jgi:hypothetical protein
MVWRMAKLLRAPLVLFFVVLVPPACLAQTYPFDYLRLDPNARAGSMAGAFAAMQDDPDLLFYNPAGLVTLKRPRASFSYMKYLLDISAGFASYSQEIDGAGWIGAGVQYLTYGNFSRTDATGSTLGSFGASDIALVGGYANYLDTNLSYGIVLKAGFSAIEEYNRAAVAVDAGMLYVMPEKRLSLAFVVQNMGTELSSSSGRSGETYALPFDIRIAGAIQPKGLPLLINLSFHKLADDAPSFLDRFRAFAVGGEFLLSKVMRLRFGYDNEKRQDMTMNQSSGLGGISAGLGVLVKAWRVDYGYSSWNLSGGLHRVSIGAAFGPDPAP